MPTTTYQREPWLLDDLFPAVDAPEVETTLAEVESITVAIEAARSELAPTIAAEDFLGIVAHIETLYRKMSALISMATLSFSADTQDQKAQNAMARMRQAAADIQNRTIFFSLWWKELDDDNAARLVAAAGDYAYWLEKLRLQRPYTLTEPVEQVINLKDVNGASALQTLYQSITNRYQFEMEIDGETRRMTRGELQVLFRDNDPDIRAAAYQALFDVYEADGPILGQIYQYLVRDWYSEHVTLRKFEQPISVRNLANHIPDDVVATLLQVHKANRGIFHRYFEMKARWLGLDKLRRSDVYAPVSTDSKEIPFADGVALTLNSFAGFDPEISQMARRVLDERHMDSEVRPGKRSGAFCATVQPDLTPWVLLSYQERPDDVATLAHELGHAIHSMLAAGHSQLTHQATLPLAETASTFAEMLLVDEMLAEDDDPAIQQSLLFMQMDDAYATIARQAGFALFEKAAHKAIRDGASVDALSALYLDMLKEELGDSVEVADEFQYEWLAIPHIYSVPFYVYAYAFGQLLVLSLYQQYQEEGESFKPKYRRILAAGGADSPENILTAAGIDMTDPDFWQGGFDVVDKMLSRLEELPVPTS